MPSTFFGLELGRRALMAQQMALDVTGHNISNASTEGYTRQVANLAAPQPYPVWNFGHAVTLGAGVDLSSVTRARDAFVDMQYRNQTSLQAYWTDRQDGMQKVQGAMNEPSANSLHGDMDAFWASFGDLANNPENAGARSVVVERSSALAEGFHQVVNQLNGLKQSFQDAAKVSVDQVNVIAKQLADLNKQIRAAEVNGDNPNDLRDQRDHLVDELSKYFNVTVSESKDPNFTDRSVNIYTVTIGLHVLVNDTSADSLQAPDFSTSPPTLNWSDGIPVQAGDGNNGNVGSVKASFDMLSYLSTLKAKYDSLAQGIADAVNAIHQQGYDLNGNPGAAFFSYTAGDAAATLDITATLKGNPSLIAAAGTAPSGGGNTAADGANALKLATFKDGFNGITVGSAPFNTPTFTQASSFSDYYGAMVAGVGVDGQEADRMTSSTAVLVNHLSNQRQSLSGVSLDEEMTNLVRFQKSYAAAARMVTMMDDMLDTIVNRLGMTR